MRINPYKLFVGAFIPNWLLEREEVSHGAKIVYGKLCQYAGEDGAAFPKVETLAKSIGFQPRMTQRYLAELVSLGLIEKVERCAQCLPSDYFFLRHEWMEGGVSCVTQGVQRDTTPGVMRVTTTRESVTKKRNIKERSLFGGESGLPDVEASYPQNRFEEFWKAYPRKVGKSLAEKAYLKVLRKKVYPYDVEQFILNSLENQKQSKLHLQREEQFIPHAATWLNSERWLDEVQIEIESVYVR